MPEVLVEALPQHRGLRAIAISGDRVTQLISEQRTGDEGCKDVALHLAQGDGRAGEGPVGEADAVPGVLPLLVGEPIRGCPFVLDVAVPIAVPELIDPRQRPVGAREQAPHGVVVEFPPPRLPEQGRCVDRPVVDVAAGQREAVGQGEGGLVEDLAGLLVTARIDVCALEAGQRLEHACGQRRLGHPSSRRPDPRRRSALVLTLFGRDSLLTGWTIGVADPQRPEILARSSHESVELGAAARHRWQCRPPARQALGRAVSSSGWSHLNWGSIGWPCKVTAASQHSSHRSPGCVRRHVIPPEPTTAGSDDVTRTALVPPVEPCSNTSERSSWNARTGIVPNLAVLDLEDPCEVGVAHQLERDRQGSRRVVEELDALVPAPADLPPADYRERCVSLTAGGGERPTKSAE